MKKIAIILTCEHAVNTIPAQYAALFAADKSILNTHEAIDFGTLMVGQYLQKKWHCPFVTAQVSRLIVDCNRSRYHSYCFSQFTKNLSLDEKKHILNEYYVPYRQQVISLVRENLAQEDIVCHLSLHSFTPVLNGEVRRADIGLLYDPKRILEKQTANQWKQHLTHAGGLHVRMNYPYTGISDGLTTTLRQMFPADRYIGIEIEINQKITQNSEQFERLKDTLSHLI